MTEALPPPEVSPGGRAEATTGRSVFRGGVWNIAARVLPQLYTIALSIAAARFLGPDDLGRQSFIAFISISAGTLFTAGFPLALMRFIAATLGEGSPGKVRDLVRWGWRIQAVTAVLGGCLVGAIGLAGAEPQAAWVLAGVVCLVSILHTVPSAVLIGAQQLKLASIVGLVTGAVSAAVSIAVLALGGGIVGMFAVEAVISTGNLVWTGGLARRTARELAPRPESSRELRGEILRLTAFLSVGVVLTLIVWRRSEFFFLEHYSTDAEIAFYSIAFATVTALLFVSDAVTGALSPAFATLYGAGSHQRLGSGYGRAVRLLLLVSLPVTAGAVALAPPLIEVAYGHEFTRAGRVLQIMLIVFPLVSLASATQALILALARRWAPAVIGLFAAATTIGLNFLLVPRHGAIGAAVANSAGQLASAAPAVAYASALVGPVRWDPGFLARGAIAAAAGGGLAWLATRYVDGVPGILLGLAAGSVVFLAVAYTVRVLAPDDAAWLEDVVGAHVGRSAGRAAGRLGGSAS